MAMEGPDVRFTEAVIDNGSYGKHVVRFESGLLAKQANGAAAMACSTRSLSKRRLGRPVSASCRAMCCMRFFSVRKACWARRRRSNSRVNSRARPRLPNTSKTEKLPRLQAVRYQGNPPVKPAS